ncbi:glycosyltransferase [Chroococcus sp. FPU101]|uniref:glycosyltransferase n=1 Tax=Chroococcus sp. FPU101 TaxID=1974212 RepID=UPI001A8DF9D3|nr:glycosyltransferase [Chroococcus sp. FPU101]GFE69554.1 glycosyltransferase, MGT family [Chroococcus sp. FPU101]
MTKIGIICPPISGHLNPLIALGQELKIRGHCITFVHVPDIESKIREAGFNFQSIGQVDYPVGAMKNYFDQLSQLRGLAELRFTLQCGQKLAEMICREAPAVLKKENIELLLVDQNEPAGSTVAEALGIPFVTICSSLALNREPGIPPVFTPWHYHHSGWSSLRNQLGYALFDQIIRPINQAINQYRRQWQLSPIRTPDDTFSQLAQISQQPPAFDFPRRSLPKCFHYVGPFRNFALDENSLAELKQTQIPLIYASLGTLHNRKPEIFENIAAACANLDVQLIISLGGGSRVTEYANLPGNPKVVEYLPQEELNQILSQASLVITHAGFNTVLESFSYGVPVVALPMTMDQPATASRISWLKAGEVIPLSQLTIPKLHQAIKKVLTDNSYHQNAIKLKTSIHQSGGVIRAADLIEQVITTGQPICCP